MSAVIRIAGVGAQGVGRYLGRVDKPDPASDCCELHEPEKAGRELVVSGRHAA